jgi:hypothetical protein
MHGHEAGNPGCLDNRKEAGSNSYSTAADLPFPWSRGGESNPGPTHYECVALPTELPRRSGHCS